MKTVFALLLLCGLSGCQVPTKPCFQTVDTASVQNTVGDSLLVLVQLPCVRTVSLHQLDSVTTEAHIRSP